MPYINFDGLETTIVKTLGIGGSEVDGKTLAEKLKSIDIQEIMGALSGLVSTGLVNCDMSTFNSKEEFEKAWFQVNPSYAKDIQNAMEPDPEPTKSKRVRRE